MKTNIIEPKPKQIFQFCYHRNVVRESSMRLSKTASATDSFSEVVPRPDEPGQPRRRRRGCSSSRVQQCLAPTAAVAQLTKLAAVNTRVQRTLGERTLVQRNVHTHTHTHTHRVSQTHTLIFKSGFFSCCGCSDQQWHAKSSF